MATLHDVQMESTMDEIEITLQFAVRYQADVQGHLQDVTNQHLVLTVVAIKEWTATIYLKAVGASKAVRADIAKVLPGPCMITADDVELKLAKEAVYHE